MGSRASGSASSRLICSQYRFEDAPDMSIARKVPRRARKTAVGEFVAGSALEGTGFEPSVPLGRIGASNSAWIEFGRRLGLRIEHAISIDGWEVCDGRTSWR